MILLHKIAKTLVATTTVLTVILPGNAWATSGQVRTESTPANNAPSSGASTQPESQFRLGISIIGHPTGLARLTAKPGESLTIPLKLTNKSDKKVNAQTFAANPVTMTNGGFAVGLTDAPKVGATRWVQLSEKPFDFAAKSSRNIDAKVAIPKDAGPGQYVVGLGIQNSEPTNNSAGGLSLGQTNRQVVSVAITLPGTLHGEVDFGEASYTNTGRIFNVDLETTNTGNRTLRSEFTLTLKDSDHNVIKSLDHTMSGFYVDTSTKLRLKLDEPLPNGQYYVDATMTGGGLTEPAVATDVPLQIGDDDNAAASPPTPTWVWVVLGLVVLLLIILAIWFVRRRKAKAVEARAAIPQSVMTADVLAFLGDRALGFRGDPVGRVTVALTPPGGGKGLDIVTGEDGPDASPIGALDAIMSIESLGSTTAESALVTKDVLDQANDAGDSFSGPATLIAVADPQAELAALQQRFLYQKK